MTSQQSAIRWPGMAAARRGIDRAVPTVTALAVVTLLGGLVAAFAVARIVGNGVAHETTDRFAIEAAALAVDVDLRLQQHEDLVAQIAGFVTAVPDADQAAFAAWSGSVVPIERYPGLVGWGHVVPSEGPVAGAGFGPGGTVEAASPGEERRTCELVLAGFAPSARSGADGLDLCAVLAPRVPSPPRREFRVELGHGTRPLVIGTTAVFRADTEATETPRHATRRGWAGVVLDPQVIADDALAGHGVDAFELRFRSGSAVVAAATGSPAASAISRSFEIGHGWSLTAFGDPPPSMLTEPAVIVTLAAGAGLSTVISAMVVLLARGRARAIRIADERSTELAHREQHDSLTGLANRASVLDRLAAALRRTEEHGAARVVVLCLDIEGFEAINDTFGHERGDELLVAVADRLRLVVPDADTIGRVGADEFVVVIEEHVGAVPAEVTAGRIIDRLAVPFTPLGATSIVTIACSLGMAVSDRVRDAADLLREAEVARSVAKAGGRHRALAYHHQMGVEAARRLALETDLPSAISRGQLHVAYQPIHRLDGLRLDGVEALVRWTHPVHGPIPPSEFVPMLERSGQIVEVGGWVLHEACAQMATWHQRGHRLDLSVNVSTRQLDDDDIVDRVAAALGASGLAASSLIVEITETGLMRRPAVAGQRLQALRGLGVRVAVDDFGTGYSSFAYLRELPLDSLKIDRQFVTSIGSSAEALALLSTLARLGRQLGLSVLAEGVETVEQLDALRRQRVDHVQGFLLSPPLAACDLELLLPLRGLATPATFAGRAPVPDRAGRRSTHATMAPGR